MHHLPIRALAIGLVSVVGLGLAVAPPTWAAVPADSLLPADTQGFLTVPDFPALEAGWSKTQLGRLMEDPVMKPFGDDLRRQLKEKWSKDHARLGIAIDDVRGLASGELALAIIHHPEAAAKAAVVLLVDVTGKEDQARSAIEKTAAGLLKQGAIQRTVEASGIKLTVLDIPGKPGVHDPGVAAYFLKDGLLMATDNLRVAEGIAGRLSGKHEAEALDKVAAYQAVIQRCQKEAGELKPLVRWFIQPVTFAEALRTWRDPRRKGGVDYLKVMKNQGFAAVQGMGGFVNFGVGRYGILHRTCVFAPPPHTLAMRMLSFPNGGDFTPQNWVSRDVATYSSFKWDVLNAFDHVDTLFDEIYGEKGVFWDTIKSVESDPNGPRIKIRDELIVPLGERATILTDYKLPITPASQRRLLAIELKDPKALAAAIDRSLKGDPRAKKLEVGEYEVWEISADEADAALDLDVQDPDELEEDRNGDQEENAAAEGQANPAVALPSSAVTVAQGHLFVSSHLDLLMKVLGELDGREVLARDPDYRLVQAEFEKLGATNTCAQGFSRTDQQFRLTFELFKTGRLPESDAIFARFLNAALGEEKEGVLRKPKLDGRKLPDFEVVRRYLGPAGSFATSEDNGWFIVGFTLTKENALAADGADGQPVVERPEVKTETNR